MGGRMAGEKRTELRILRRESRGNVVHREHAQNKSPIQTGIFPGKLMGNTASFQ